MYKVVELFKLTITWFACTSTITNVVGSSLSLVVGALVGGDGFPDGFADLDDKASFVAFLANSTFCRFH